MIIAALPVDEEQRLKDLYSYDLLDSKPETDYDDLVELAGYICGCPISIITLIDKDRQWYKSKKGITISETSRKDSFCSHAILNNEILEVRDASKDERFFDNPLVTGNPGIRFYAGSPIISPTGHKLGTICVIDHTPKKLTSQQEKALTQLSNQVSRLLELRKKNTLIRQRAMEIISIKSNAITQVIKHNWSENKSLAYNLHEGLAQEIAGCLMTLQSALTNDPNRLPLLGAVKTQLQTSLVKIKEMSYSVAPLTTDLLPVQALIEEYIEKVKAGFPFEINFNNIGEKNIKTSDKTALLIYVIEAWLTHLLCKKEISQINITLNVQNAFELTMEDDSSMLGLQELSDHVYASLLKEMVVSDAGFIKIFVPKDGKNIVKITIPIHNSTL
jgi:GAF domain